MCLCTCSSGVELVASVYSPMWGLGVGGGIHRALHPGPPARPQATPTADTAMLFFETNRLGFTPEVLGRIR